MKRIVSIAVVLAVTPACDLLLDPSSHTGHVRDTGASDASDTGVPTADVGPHDAGTDAWAPPQCTTPSDCGAAGTAGLVQCLANRCVFCASPAAAPLVIRHGANLHPYASLGIRTQPTSPALVLVGTTGSTSAMPPLVHSVPIDAPTSAMDVPLLPALEATCTGPTITSASDITFYPDPDPVSTSTTVGVVAQTASTSILTQVDWPSTGTYTSDSHAMCNTQTLPAAYEATTEIMTSPGTDRVAHVLQMARASDGMGGFSYLGFDTPGAARSQYYNGFQSPTDAYALMTHAGPYMLLGAMALDTVVWWDPEVPSGGPEFLMTPGRTGDPTATLLTGTATMAGELLHFLVAYPVGSSVRFVDVDCQSGCNPVGQANDVATGAMSVTAARFGLASGVPVLLTSERPASGGEQVVLRVLRANDTPFDAPGGGTALVLETAPAGSTITDIQLAIVGGTMTRYAVLWVVTDAAGAPSVRLQTFLASCP